MSQTYQDPVVYLNNTVSKRGKSGPEGVYLSNVTVVFEASTPFNYKTSVETITAEEPPEIFNETVWNRSLISLRANHRLLQITLHSGDDLYQVLVDGNCLSLNVFCPSVEVSMFAYNVVQAQEVLSFMSDFSGKVAKTVRFNIGLATKSWEDMVDDGEAEEVEFSF